MNLQAAHTFPAPPHHVARAMVDPDFYAALELVNVGPPVVLEHEASPTVLRVRVGFAYLGPLDPMARTILGTDQFGWEQSLRLDPNTGAGELQIVPSVHAGRMCCTGMITMTPQGDATLRTLRAVLSIGVPLLGGRAERALAPGILERLDGEARALAEFLVTNC